MYGRQARPNYLFQERDSHSVLDGHRGAMSQEIENLDSDQILNTNIDDLCQYYVDKFTLTTPSLHPDKAIADQSEIDIDISQDRLRHVHDRSQPYYIKGTIVTVEVPFEGSGHLFTIRPSRYTMSPPIGTIKGNTLTLSEKGINLDSEKVQQDLKTTIDEITSYLDNLRTDFEGFNRAIEPTVRPQLEKRRDKLLKDKNLVENIGFPLKARKGEAKTYPAPDVRRKITPVMPQPSKAPFHPEPALPDEHYNHILEVIKNMVVVMERSPSAFANMGEEHLRDHFLVQLNGHFEGKATGETFNFNGKTDILIRAEDKNIFIGECKFWRGPKSYLETIDQILSYTSWRDTKVAVLIFNRNKDFSKVLQAMDAETPKHSNYKRTVTKVNETEIQYQFHHNDDKNRQLVLTVLAFEVPS